MYNFPFLRDPHTNLYYYLGTGTRGKNKRRLYFRCRLPEIFHYELKILESGAMKLFGLGYSSCSVLYNLKLVLWSLIMLHPTCSLVQIVFLSL